MPKEQPAASQKYVLLPDGRTTLVENKGEYWFSEEEGYFWIDERGNVALYDEVNDNWNWVGKIVSRPVQPKPVVGPQLPKILSMPPLPAIPSPTSELPSGSPTVIRSDQPTPTIPGEKKVGPGVIGSPGLEGRRVVAGVILSEDSGYMITPSKKQPTTVADSVRRSAVRTSADIQIKLGGFWIRVLAAVLDIYIVLGLSAVVIFLTKLLLGIVFKEYSHIIKILSIVIIITIGILYEIFLLGKSGKTIGKRVFGLMVLRSNNSIVTTQIALRRLMGKVINLLTFGIGYLVIMFRENKQGLHDGFAGTKVVCMGNPSRILMIVMSIVLFLITLGGPLAVYRSKKVREIVLKLAVDYLPVEFKNREGGT